MALNSSAGEQLTYSRQETALLPGQLVYDSAEQDSYVFSELLAAGVNSLAFGLGVVHDSAGGIRLPIANVENIVFTGDFITGNVINLLVNGVALSATTFATDSATTLAAVATKIALQPNIASAVATEASHSILVTGTSGHAVVITGILVTSGASQVTGTATASSTDTYFGQPIYDPTAVSGTGFSPLVEIAMTNHTMGFTAFVSATVSAQDKAYLDLTGKYTNVSTNNIPTFGRFVKGATSGDLAIININLPQG